MAAIHLSLTSPLYRDLLGLMKKGESETETIRRLIREAADSKAGKKDRLREEPGPHEPGTQGV